jgi:hypothetical protein
MIDLLRRNPLIATLTMLCAALAVVLAIEVATLAVAPAPKAPTKVAGTEMRLLPPIAAVSPEAAYPETAARPLWIPPRRPAPPAVVAQPSFARGQFVLQGAIIAGNTRIAMLKEKASGRIHRVEQGKDVNGLQVVEVHPERVTLVQGAEREVVELMVQRQGTAPGTPSAAATTPTTPGVRLTGPFATQAPQAPAPAGGSFPSGPMAPSPVPAGGAPTSPGGTPVPPGGAPTAAATTPGPDAVPTQTTAPMTPEELLARRRARRNISP